MAVESEFYEQTELWGSTNDLDRERTDIRASEMAKLLPPDVESILDVGTGDGRLLAPLLRRLDHTPRVIGLDRSATALSHLEDRDLDGVQASADALPFADDAFDVIIACEILEHLPQPVYEATRRELARVARRSVVITVPNRERMRAAEIDCSLCGCRYNRRRHLRRFELAAFDDLLAGFSVAGSAEFGHHTRVYPRRARQSLERHGVLGVHDAPECPQCGNPHGRRVAASGVVTTGGSDRNTDRYWRFRQLVPAQRQPYWLGVRLDRC